MTMMTVSGELLVWVKRQSPGDTDNKNPDGKVQVIIGNPCFLLLWYALW